MQVPVRWERRANMYKSGGGGGRARKRDGWGEKLGGRSVLVWVGTDGRRRFEDGLGRTGDPCKSRRGREGEKDVCGRWDAWELMPSHSQPR